MEPVKPTVKRCVDGGDHHWLVVNEDTDIVKKTRWERRWCEKCGVLTQVTVDDDGNATVLLKGTRPHLVVPKLVQLMTRKSTVRTVIKKKPAKKAPAKKVKPKKAAKKK
jgi:hypothetical protein